MKLSSKLIIDPIEYASQGNAILGIRDSGKTYTGTYLAEQLFDAKIPFIAFDPIGVWRNLKIGKKGAGYPVVVAGDNGDLPLTANTAADIVRAAMTENVSLVIDLYSMHLSKADWKKIVEQSIRLLLYENKPHGLRHIFIEEASEFVPQIVRPDEGRVYAEIEKLARMGGNASLGYTLINQRAEQINKAVLELCDCLFLHRQKGRHSITALGKWLDAADATNTKEILNSLPSLSQGECWVWLQGSHEPVRIKMPEKKTVHPDRRNPLASAGGVQVDVSSFVRKLNAALNQRLANISSMKVTKATIKKVPPGHYKDFDHIADIDLLIKDNDMELQKNYDILSEENIKLKEKLATETALRKDAEKRLETVRALLKPQFDQLSKIFSNIKEEHSNGADRGKYQMWLDKFDGKHKTMFELIIEHGRLDRRRWCVLAGINYNSTWFDKGANKMRQLKLVAKEGNDFVLQEI
jgi:hypothetical protein